MPDQEITWRLIVEDQEAQQKFRQVGDSIDEMKDKGKDSVPVLGEVKDALGETGGEADVVSGSVGILGKIIGGGLVVAVSAATIALIKLGKEFLTTDTEIKNLTSKLRENWLEAYKAAREWERFNREIERFRKGELIASLQAIEKEMGDIVIKSKQWTDLLRITELLGVTGFEERLKILKAQHEIIKAVLGQPTTLTKEDVPDDMLKKWREFLRGTKAEVKELAFEFKNLEQAQEFLLAFVYGKEGVPIPKGGLDMSKIKNYKSFMGMGMKQVKETSKPKILLTDEELQQLYNMEDYFAVMANTLRWEFSSAWQDIFGEANSLFEKLLMNIMEMLASKALTSLFGSFMNFLIPGSGAFLGWALPNSSTGGGINVNLVIDNRTLAQVHVSGRHQANRLRMS